MKLLHQEASDTDNYLSRVRFGPDRNCRLSSQESSSRHQRQINFVICCRGHQYQLCWLEEKKSPLRFLGDPIVCPLVPREQLGAIIMIFRPRGLFSSGATMMLSNATNDLLWKIHLVLLQNKRVVIISTVVGKLQLIESVKCSLDYWE